MMVESNITYGLGVRGKEASAQLVDEGSMCVDLAIGERDPLVHKSGLLQVRAE